MQARKKQKLEAGTRIVEDPNLPPDWLLSIVSTEQRSDKCVQKCQKKARSEATTIDEVRFALGRSVARRAAPRHFAPPPLALISNSLDITHHQQVLSPHPHRRQVPQQGPNRENLRVLARRENQGRREGVEEHEVSKERTTTVEEGAGGVAGGGIGEGGEKGGRGGRGNGNEEGGQGG